MQNVSCKDLSRIMALIGCVEYFFVIAEGSRMRWQGLKVKNCGETPRKMIVSNNVGEPSREQCGKNTNNT